MVISTRLKGGYFFCFAALKQGTQLTPHPGIVSVIFFISLILYAYFR